MKLLLFSIALAAAEPSVKQPVISDADQAIYWRAAAKFNAAMTNKERGERMIADAKKEESEARVLADSIAAKCGDKHTFSIVSEIPTCVPKPVKETPAK